LRGRRGDRLDLPEGEDRKVPKALATEPARRVLTLLAAVVLYFLP